jgi:acyl-CoA reductase-like NAD-dependent aldehyde dehydrogenase
MLINGKAVAGAARRLEVVNPATEDVMALVPNATPDELSEAVDAASRAYSMWSQVAPAERAGVVRRIGEVLGDHAEELAVLLTREQGKPLAAARREVARGPHWCEVLAGLDVPWDDVRDSATHRVRVRRVPLGVVAVIVPWNFPVSLALWKIVPALLAGNTVVVKPSPFTPLTALRIGELIADVVPAGVVNVVTGDDSLGPRLTSHPKIAKVAFTGSTATGKRVMQSAAENLLSLTLELGGNDPAIVLPDVDLDDLAPKLFWACFQNNAQYCIAAKRVYIHDSIYDRLLAKVVEYARGVVVGDGLEPESQLGPMQNRVQFDKVMAMVEACRRDGLSFALEPMFGDGAGFFMSPGIIDNPPESSAIVQEEPFGPIVPFLRYHDLADAVARANASPYGLAGSVWGRDLAAAESVAERIESGVVWVNEIQRIEPDLPFGGRKVSGVGVENGLEGILAYTDTQVLSLPKET